MLSGGRKYTAFVVTAVILVITLGAATFVFQETPEYMSSFLQTWLLIFGGSYGALTAGNSMEHKYNKKDA